METVVRELLLVGCSVGQGNPGCSPWRRRQCTVSGPAFSLPSAILERSWYLFLTVRDFVCLVSSWSGFFQPSFVRIISMQRRADLYLHDLVLNMVSVDRYCCHKCLQLLD